MRRPGIESLAATMLIAAVFIAGCGQDAAPTASGSITSNPRVAVCTLRDYEGFATLCTDPMADSASSSVTVCWGDTSIVFNEKYVSPGKLGFNWYPDPWPSGHMFGDTVLTVRVQSNSGYCQGSIRVPRPVWGRYPRYRDTVAIDTITYIWYPVEWAQWYKYTMHIDAFDSLGYYYCVTTERGQTTDTTYTIPDSVYLYPWARYYEVSFAMQSVSGPLPQAGSVANMSGTIQGFLTGESYATGYYFFVGSLPKKQSSRRHCHFIDSLVLRKSFVSEPGMAR